VDEIVFFSLENFRHCILAARSMDFIEGFYVVMKMKDEIQIVTE
jgi:hypothetical protein